MNATPRPWTIQDGRAGNRIWRLTGMDLFPVCAGDNLADAVLIHRAVNSFDAMQQALEAVAHEWERTECPLSQLGPQAPQWIRAVKAALALAKGGEGRP